MMINGSMKWNVKMKCEPQRFACNWRVLYMENLPGKTISNAIINVGNRNAPTFRLILTISTWLRIYKLTTGSCDVRYAIGTNYCEDKELVEILTSYLTKLREPIRDDPDTRESLEHLSRVASY